MGWLLLPLFCFFDLRGGGTSAAMGDIMPGDIMPGDIIPGDIMPP